MATSVPVSVEQLIDNTPAIDQVAESFQNLARQAFASMGKDGTRVRNVLNGIWLGHPLHAAITDVPIGAWSTAVTMDYLGVVTGNRQLGRCADAAVAVGCVGAAAAAVAGIADYSEVEGEQRRTGAVHAALNAIGLVGFLGSLWCRNKNDRSGGIFLATLAYAATIASSYLGGHMVYRQGANVSRQAWAEGPTEFTAVLSASDLDNGQMKKVEAGGMEILLAKLHGKLFAMGNSCTHWGCSLADGTLEGQVLTCHCHGSQFNLVDGSVVNGPATAPEPVFEARQRNGQIEIRRR